MLSSSEKKQLVEELSSRLDDILVTDEHKSEVFLLKWLEARDFNPNKAEEMIRSSFKWRVDNKIDSLRKKKIDRYFKIHFPVRISGEDRHGNPVSTFHFGKWDIKQVVNEGRGDEFIEYMMYVFEKLSRKIRRRSKGENPASGITSVIDFEGYSYSQVLSVKVLQLLMALVSDIEANYPGILHKGFLINCPRIFSMLWKVIKPILCQKTQDAVVILGSNRKEWEAAVRELVDPSQLTIQFGGDLSE